MKRLVYLIFATVAFACYSVAVHSATLIQDTEIESVVYELIEPLSKSAGIPDNRLGIYIIAEDDFNAFIRAGEDIYIYTGLVESLENPNAFQAVIAHELGHMVGGHIVQMSARLRDEMARSLMIQALGVALMVTNPMAGAGILAGSSGIAQQSVLSFSRDEERIADNMGIDLLIKAKLPVDGFLEIIKYMQDNHGAMEENINPNRTNHPLTSERLKNVREKIAATNYKSPKNTYIDTSEFQKRYALVRAKLTGYLASLNRINSIYPSKDKSDPAVYARAIGNMRGGNLDAAKTGAETLISRAEANPFFYELLGDIEYQYGHYDDSVQAYEKSLSLIKDGAPQIQTALALVLSERKKPGDINRSIEMCKRSLLKDASPLTYWVLARAEQSRGNDGISDWAMAEYYSMRGDMKNAKKYAKAAQKKLPKDSPEYLKASDILRN